MTRPRFEVYCQTCRRDTFLGIVRYSAKLNKWRFMKFFRNRITGTKGWMFGSRHPGVDNWLYVDCPGCKRRVKVSAPVLVAAMPAHQTTTRIYV